MTERRQNPRPTPPLSLTFETIGLIDAAAMNDQAISQLAEHLSSRPEGERARDLVLLLKSFRNAVRASITDPLTGLWNRQGFALKVMHKIESIRSHEPDEPSCGHAQSDMAAIFIDLDGFKAVNDHCGHDVGDAALKEIARRLTAAFRADDVIARPGGDEITLMLEPYHPSEAFNETHIEQRIRKALDGIVYWHDNKPYPICASIGIFIFNAETVRAFGDKPAAEIAAELMENADKRMYLDKQAGKTTRLDEARVQAHLTREVA